MICKLVDLPIVGFPSLSLASTSMLIPSSASLPPSSARSSLHFSSAMSSWCACSLMSPFACTRPNHLGKVRANFFGTEFQIYDSGINYSDGGSASDEIRQELGCVLYASNVLGSRGPRKMQVCINKVDEAKGQVKWQPRQKDDEMLTLFKNKDEYGMKNLVSLINKPPRWNDQVGAYVLNFNGRVTMASVKNFQLVDQFDHDNIILQFGRVAKDEFTCDFQWPITPFQAFAITLSSFDSKIACD